MDTEFRKISLERLFAKDATDAGQRFGGYRLRFATVSQLNCLGGEHDAARLRTIPSEPMRLWEPWGNLAQGLQFLSRNDEAIGRRYPKLRHMVGGLNGPGSIQHYAVRLDQLAGLYEESELLTGRPISYLAVLPDELLQMRKRIAVLGLYRSGSTMLAGTIARLGVYMGKEFYMDFYEPEWLSRQLRSWWNEPYCEATVSADAR